MDFFTSDLHFGHNLMVNKAKWESPYRDYATIDEHDHDIISKINHQATSYLDTIYIIGDLSFHKPLVTADLLSRITAKKVLVKGNHDNRTKNKMGALLSPVVMEELTEFHTYLERKFKVWTIRGGGAFDEQNIVMFHFPIMHWRNQDKGWWHLHGHLHGNPSGVPGKCLDVGWDAHGKLLTLEDIRKEMDKLPLRGNHHTEGTDGRES
jgi:calcineurin-like phosphoesterase family protein